MEAETCEVCTDTLDATDSSISFCDCNYALCLWCWHRICEDAAKDDLPARCPNCRAEYDQERIRKQRLDPVQMEEVRKKQKKEEKKKGGGGGGGGGAPVVKQRKDLVNVRVVQRNLVYVVGLALELCYEDLLKGPEYFGQFGKVVKISVSRAGPYGTAAAKNGPSGSAYITYRWPQDAHRCIETVHGAVWEGKAVKACFGTTKYCNAFLKGLVCNNSDCLYLHAVADDEDSYTKEETKTAKFVNLVHAATLGKELAPIRELPPVPPAAPPAPANGNHAAAPRPAAAQAQQQQQQPPPQAAPAANGNGGQIRREPSSDLDRAPLATASLPEPLTDQQVNSSSGWPALGGATWAAKATAVVAAAAAQQPAPQQQQQQQQAPPPPPDMATQDWPELPGAGEPSDTPGAHAVAPVAAQLQRKGSTMAAELARAASAPNGGAAAKEERSTAAAARAGANGAVLIVPKKAKQTVPPGGGRTPRKLPAAAAAAAPASPPVPVLAPEAAENNGGKTSASEEPAPSADMPGRAAAAQGKRRAKQQQPEADAGGVELGPAADKAPAPAAAQSEADQEPVSVPVKPDCKVDEAGADAAAKLKGSKVPPPGFEALNGTAKAAATGRPKKGPPPGFATSSDQGASANGGSPFQSYGSESSTTSAAPAQPARGANAGALQAPPGKPSWDPAAAANTTGDPLNLPSLDAIWGSDSPTPVMAKLALQNPAPAQHAARSRSRFDFAQDGDSAEAARQQEQQAGMQQEQQPPPPVPYAGSSSRLTLAGWLSPEPSPAAAAHADPGRALLHQLQGGGAGGGMHHMGLGNGTMLGAGGFPGGLGAQPLQQQQQQQLQPGFFPLAPPKFDLAAAQALQLQQQQQRAAQQLGVVGTPPAFGMGPASHVAQGVMRGPAQLPPAGFHHHAGPPKVQDAQSLEARWLDTTQRIRNMAV